MPYIYPALVLFELLNFVDWVITFFWWYNGAYKFIKRKFLKIQNVFKYPHKSLGYKTFIINPYITLYTWIATNFVS
jgi:hypothetical protein